MVMSIDSAESSDAEVFFGRFQLDKRRRQLLKDGVEVRIGSRGFDILIALTERAGELVSKRDLLFSVWREVVVDEAVLRVHVASLRRALGEGQDGARYIVTVSGRGYSFVAPIERKRAMGLHLPDTFRPPGMDATSRRFPDCSLDGTKSSTTSVRSS
ncbi:winged helix-turn-helix domain-containing protein [Bradyrhizobium sp. CCBAU 21362]|uniref:winged helix-turn-helix domain-containing protein n=1 Tax=Bradyrhizobium sp. CCBAU 21362 TaxID=1325082 RepID=UPI00230518A5|nr:transcriptional regulator [Bradyrhizobium sp. CCBAU 21362]